MKESRQNLTSSDAGSSSANALAKSRRVTTIPYFAPADQSFKPRPYIRNCASLNFGNSSSNPSTAPAISAMDPSPSDPGTVFIHPPFNEFPDSHLHPEGLSYSLLAEHTEWFLDEVDYVSFTPTSDRHEAITYPPQLEPPRGWMPTKKKDAQVLGADSWPEGEEPRLRCTFCRRTYAGINARSMWRRHVYEKHNIVMVNRREGADPPRVGRGSQSTQTGFIMIITDRILQRVITTCPPLKATKGYETIGRVKQL